MTKCLNPECSYQNPEQSPSLNFCQQCGARLRIGDRYRALRVLGQGGFGKTFIGIDEALPSRPLCVIKQFLPADLSSSAKAAELFQQEAVRLDDLGKHPQIPTLFAHLELDQRQYLIQEFIDGQDLLKELQEQGAFSEAKIRMLLSEVLPILQFIHERQVIHRDIKPENIIRRRSPPTQGEPTKIASHVLVDFGAAKFVTTSELMRTGTRIGSLAYLAPEQSRGKAIFASDIYSLGVTCIHLLTDVSPLDLMDMDGQWIWQEFLPHPINPQLAKILDRMIVTASSQRYQTAQAVIQDLQTLSQSPPSYSPMRSRSPNPQRHPKKNLQGNAKTQITPISAPKPPIQVSIPPLSSFSYETAMVTVSQGANLIKSLQSWGAPLKPQIQIATKSKIGNLFVEHLGELKGRSIDLEMVHIPAGKFRIGSPMTELEHSPEEQPQTWINVPSLFMSRYPITQNQWKVIMDNNPSIFIGNGDRPVEMVSWQEVKQFCQKLMERSGKPYRLPSESEWEYTCRAGTMTPFSCGATITANLANYNYAIADPYQNYQQAKSANNINTGQTSVVGTYPANQFGLHDHHGNVWEWCEDVWHDDYDLIPRDGTAWTQGGDQSCRVIRGGSWRDSAHYCRSAHRSRNAANQGDRYTGFRVVISTPTTSS